MISDLNQILSTSIKGMKKSAIRELLKLTSDPEIISFAGGLPAPESFPVKELNEVIAKVMRDEPALALQYGSTEGDNLLRTLLVERYRKEGLDISLKNLIITTASQQALDHIAKIFVNRGDKVIVGLPSYLGALGAFNSYGADMVGIPLDEYGMSAEILEEELKKLKAMNQKPKFIYVIPDFQNPSGITMPKERRLEIIDIAKRYDVLIVEDSPYRELRFEGEPVQTMYALDNTEQVITLGTFSKIFAPGFRIGWVIGNEDILDKIVTAKQSSDLCTPPYTQRIAARYLEAGHLDTNINNIIDLYRDKRDGMLNAFREYMPKEVHWTEPDGGLFLFVTLPEHMDSEKLFMEAIKQKVAFVSGTSFYCNGEGKNTMRINFSYSSKEVNIEGSKRLAKVIKDNL
ncbi:MAG: PLP-dependent aminotransferase family protein [Candidatus Cloacimonas sp.]|nr:PLP-dependent aminotransferase family protein [Candidatus Cloacimonadota bacterium]